MIIRGCLPSTAVAADEFVRGSAGACDTAGVSSVPGLSPPATTSLLPALPGLTAVLVTSMYSICQTQCQTMVHIKVSSERLPAPSSARLRGTNDPSVRSGRSSWTSPSGHCVLRHTSSRTVRQPAWRRVWFGAACYLHEQTRVESGQCDRQYEGSFELVRASNRGGACECGELGNGAHQRLDHVLASGMCTACRALYAVDSLAVRARHECVAA